MHVTSVIHSVEMSINCQFAVEGITQAFFLLHAVTLPFVISGGKLTFAFGENACNSFECRAYTFRFNS